MNKSKTIRKIGRSSRTDSPKFPKYRETKQKLANLFDNIVILGNKKGVFLPSHYEILERNRQELRERLQEAWSISETLKRLKTDDILGGLPPKARSMNKMLIYLGLVESLGVTLADMVLILLIVNGKEMHTRGAYIKHVTTLEELSVLNLAYKLQFLKLEKLGIFELMISRKVRNDIAHLKFRIAENGAIRNLKGKLIMIDDAISNFWKGAYTLMMVLDGIGFMEWIYKEVPGHD